VCFLSMSMISCSTKVNDNMRIAIAEKNAQIIVLEIENQRLSKKIEDLSSQISGIKDRYRDSYRIFSKSEDPPSLLLETRDTSFPFGITRFRGYYAKKVLNYDYGVIGYTAECEFFVILETDPKLLDLLQTQIEGGNYFNDTIDGKIALPVMADSPKELVIEKLRLSEKNMPITIWGYLVQTVLAGNMETCNEYLIPIAVAE